MGSASFTQAIAGKYHSNSTINKLTGNINTQNSSNITDLNSNFAQAFNKQTGAGWGFDAVSLTSGGLNSSLLKDQTPYRLKIGVAVTDIGSVSYKDITLSKRYALNADGFPTSELKKGGSETWVIFQSPGNRWHYHKSGFQGPYDNIIANCCSC